MRIRMRVIVLIVISCVLFLCGYNGYIFAQPRANVGGPLVKFGVSPPIFELSIGARNKPNALRVMNIGKEPITLRVDVFTWELDEDNQLQIVPPTEQSLDQWILINPLQFTVEPEKIQVVRFSIRPKVKPEPGEHRAIIYISDATQPKKGKRNVSGRIGVGVYGYVGEVTRIGKLNAVEIVQKTNPIIANFDISSQGSAHVRMTGQYAIWSVSAYPGIQETTTIPELDNPQIELPEGIVEAGFLPSVPILPDSRRTIQLRTTSQLPPGEYVLDINGDLSGTPLDLSKPFTVSAENSQ